MSVIERHHNSFKLHRNAANVLKPSPSISHLLSLRQPQVPGGDGSGSTSGTCEEHESSWIIKPLTDERAYKHIKLANQLEAIVVSDPSCHSAAAALCVAAGQLDDPGEVQGLAHFLEHMLFLGTHKFPEESNFDEICGKSAGYSNAWTSLDHTMYHFIVSHDRLEQVLERFAAFFSCPLFSESGTEREMNAVDSEHNKNLKDDDRRENQLLRSTCSSDHSMSRFGGGNLETLLEDPKKAGINVREKLLQFHERFYSANAMRLAVIGKEPVDKLEELVTSFFSDVPNRQNVPLRDWISSVPYDASWKRSFYISPISGSHAACKLFLLSPDQVTERRRLAMFFPIPPIQPFYKTKPAQLISHLIGHEGPGSLLAVLKELGYASELSAGPVRRRGGEEEGAGAGAGKRGTGGGNLRS
ncbi:hypothetical protein GUITHDRAFT_72179 [Guillardia theta CCMP2712]|uniref:Peptidase M16 N-terminal domain-containing protein n=2 Tax=Guillardia theta TaxID=55529 RepID=L1J7Y1_GUITC|nr:hypothetical protein GUITHDRAFT_72179 [Guillardia theta CCMP2712]EKX44432.1 hypothetical protein GUITHDRAFT_72179 [Guillardia theta CCMP2712]|eukprot:XP_005831412.1 hypothetical protein GUITHDRAFT_72179 [Guillardia theta CCMP2712]